MRRIRCHRHPSRNGYSYLVGDPARGVKPFQQGVYGRRNGIRQRHLSKTDPFCHRVGKTRKARPTGNRGTAPSRASPVPRVARRVAGCAAKKVTWDRSARCVGILRVSGQNGCFPFVCGSTMDFTLNGRKLSATKAPKWRRGRPRVAPKADFATWARSIRGAEALARVHGGGDVLGTWSGLLPHERDQAPRHLVLVFRVARQFFGKKLFLIEQSPDERRHHEGEDGQSPP